MQADVLRILCDKAFENTMGKEGNACGNQYTAG